MKNYQMQLKKDKLPQKMIPNLDPNYFATLMTGTKKNHSKFGLLDLKTKVQTSSWIKLQVSNIWLKLEIHAKVPGNGQQRKVLCQKKT